MMAVLGGFVVGWCCCWLVARWWFDRDLRRAIAKSEKARSQ